MRRRFAQHQLRDVQDLAGVWDFAFLGDVDADAVDVSAIRYEDRQSVPGCFDATPAYAGFRGLAAYRTRAAVRDETPHRLILDAVHHWGRVFVDGMPLRDHVGGFVPFAVDLPARAPGEVEIVVLVDNRINYERCPLHMDHFDWYHFGGIARGVELHRLGNLWIDSLRIATEDYAARRLSVTIDYAAAGAPAKAELEIRCGDASLLSETVNVSEKGDRIERTIEMPGAALWSPDEPNLHMLDVRLGEDDCRERVGIRRVAIDGRDILINGQPVRLLGFCRHEAHPQFGCALPEQLLVSDVQQLKDLGCNFIRGSHYPQDAAFLDLCDEAGLCVWNESIGWQQHPPQLTDERFIAAQLQNIDEMVASSFNRPSVIMWGILNESDSFDESCRPAYQRLLARLRELDATRPVTYACNHWKTDICMDLADIISINMYPGWYAGTIEQIPYFMDEVVEHFDRLGHGDKPMIISEIGAGAIYGWRDWHGVHWSEQYQDRLLDTTIRHMFHDRDRYCGLAIWQFCDIRTAQNVEKAIVRPRCFNNKGVVDEYRREKQAYFTVREHFRQLGGNQPQR